MFASCQLLSEKIIEFDDGFNVIIIPQQWRFYNYRQSLLSGIIFTF